MDSSIKIGITGGIGSGKTTVCNIFECMGVPVYYADREAKRLMQEDNSLRKAIIDNFGKDAYREDGALNRTYLSNQVFNDPEKLERLNALVHPVVAKDVEAWHRRHASAPYTLKEAALLFESGSYRQLDRVVLVYAPVSLRIKRVMARDGVPEEAVRKRIQAQMKDEEKLPLANHVIINDGELSILEQVWRYHQMFMNMKG